MESLPIHPKLRALDFKWVMHEGMQYMHLRDPLAISPRALIIPEPFVPVLALLDGTRDLKTIRFSLSQRYNLRLDQARLLEIVQALEDSCMLENGAYLAARRRALAEYHAAPFRVSPLAGRSYPADPKGLDEFFLNMLSPAEQVLLAANSGPQYRGLLSPHIDYERGGPVYARAWSTAAQTARAAELVIILGTDHFAEETRLTLTRQSYATPYGVLPLPENLLTRLTNILGEENAYQGELHHRGEHSIELACVWLHFARRGQPVELLPILVGDLSSIPQRQVDRFIAELQRELHRRRVLIVAAGDLSHVGPAFGAEPVAGQDLAEVSAADADILTAWETGKIDALQSSLTAAEDNNVCGAECILLTQRILGSTRLDRLGYAACPADDENTSFVTIAGAGLY